jgi:hypothetical protein
VVLFALGYGALAVALLHKVFRAKKDISRSLKIAEDNLYNKIMADEDLYSRSFHALFESEDE